MMTTGSKIFFGFSLVGLFAAILYGVITNGVDQGGIAHLLSGNGAIDAIVGPLTLGYKGGVGDHLGYAVLLGFSVNMAGLGVASLAFRDADAEALAQKVTQAEARLRALGWAGAAPSAVSTVAPHQKRRPAGASL